MSTINASTELDGPMRNIRIFTTLAATIHGIMLWDLVICLPSEVKYIFWPDLVNLLRRGKLPSLTTCLLLISRLLVIPMVSLGKTIDMGAPSNCLAVYRALLVLNAIGVSTATAVFVVRTLTIRSSRWPLALILWSLWALQSIAWFYWSTFPSLGRGPRPNAYFSTCQNLSNNPTWTWVIYLIFGLFDLLILVLTLELYIRHFGCNSISPFHQYRKPEKKKKEVSEQFFQDTILYFSLSLCVSILEVVWILSHLHQQFYTALMGPIQVWLTIIVSPRVIRNIKLYTARTARLEGNITLATIAVSTKSGGVGIVEAKCNQDFDAIRFDTSILDKVGAIDHYFPPAQIRTDVNTCTARGDLPLDVEKQ